LKVLRVPMALMVYRALLVLMVRPARKALLAQTRLLPALKAQRVQMVHKVLLALPVRIRLLPVLKAQRVQMVHKVLLVQTAWTAQLDPRVQAVRKGLKVRWAHKVQPVLKAQLADWLRLQKLAA
jgi:hypothetical protein